MAKDPGMVRCLARAGGISRYASAHRSRSPAVPKPDDTAAAYTHIADKDCPKKNPIVPKTVRAANKGPRRRNVRKGHQRESNPSITIAKPFDSTFRIQLERLKDSGITPKNIVEKKAR